VTISVSFKAMLKEGVHILSIDCKMPSKESEVTDKEKRLAIPVLNVETQQFYTHGKNKQLQNMRVLSSKNRRCLKKKRDSKDPSSNDSLVSKMCKKSEGIWNLGS
jgi:hypothetical protein